MGKAFTQTVLPIAGMVLGNMILPGAGMMLGGALGGAVGGHSYGGGTSGMLGGAALGGAGGYLAGLGGAGAAAGGATDMGGATGLSLGSSGVGLAGPSSGYFSGLGGQTAGGLGLDAATAGSALGGGLGMSQLGTGTAADSNQPFAGGGSVSDTGAGLSLPSSGGSLGLQPPTSFESGLAPGTSGLGDGGAGLGVSGSTGGSGGGVLDSLKEYMTKLQELGKSTGVSGALGAMGKIGSGVNVLSGLYGMATAGKTAAAADPFAQYRAGYGQQLQQLNANPGSVTSLPGYQAGLEAVQRSLASQGYTGSGNAMLALQKYGGDFFAQQQARLAQLAGASATPGQGAAIGSQQMSGGMGTLGLGLAGLLKGA